MRATPTKLKDESWGIRVTGGIPEVGDEVNVYSRSGKQWTSVVASIEATFDYQGEEITLCRTAEKGEKPKRNHAKCNCDCAACQACAHKAVGGAEPGSSDADDLPF